MAVDTVSLTNLAIVEAMQALFALLSASPASLIDEYGDEFVFGPVLDESESFSNRVSQHAIEGSGNVADHVHPEPGIFTVQTRLADDNCILSQIGNLAASAIGIENKTVTEKIQLLKSWRESGSVLTYAGPSFFLKENYDIVESDLVINRLDIKRNAKQGLAPFVMIQLQKVLVVESVLSSIDIPQFMKQTAKKGKAATQKVKQNVLKSSSWSASH